MATDEQATTTQDELARARAARGLSPDGDPTKDAEGNSIEGMEADGSIQTVTGADGQEAFFLEQGRKVSFGTIVKRGTDVEYRVKFGGMSVKGKGEPIPLDVGELILAGRFRSGGLNFVPTHDDDGRVERVKVYATLKPVSFVDPNSIEGRTLLGVSSMLRTISYLRDEGLSDEQIREEFEAAIAEPAAA